MRDFLKLYWNYDMQWIFYVNMYENHTCNFIKPKIIIVLTSFNSCIFGQNNSNSGNRQNE